VSINDVVVLSPFFIAAVVYWLVVRRATDTLGDRAERRRDRFR
jgi:hypothetical protein